MTRCAVRKLVWYAGSLFLALNILLAARLSVVAAAPADGDKQIDFARHVKPLLVQHCYDCHAGDEAEGGVRWDRKSALLGGDSGEPSVVPKKPEASRLIHLVRGDDDERMPPEDEGESLTEAEIAILVRWIEQGADWPDEAQAAADVVSHWSFQPPQRHEFPRVKQSDWPRNLIDHFALAKMEEQGLSPAAEADRYTLCRRVYLDIVGVPPTPEQADAFVNDTSADAYERLVDRLLNSPRYGERWARMWLDLARYADTQGYEKDNRRTIWRYRDWVVDAFNSDMPFDQFTNEQLAGDLLPHSSVEQRVATAFHRNTMTNTEGGTDNEEWRTAAIVDRVNTTGQVWLGLTVGCAQCHSHKYDPITQREYYQLFAFMNQTADADLDDETPTMRVPKRSAYGQMASRMKEIDQLNETLKISTPELEAAEADWAGRLASDAKQTPPSLEPWFLIGPFQAADFNEAHAKIFPPESEIDLNKTYEDGALSWNLREDLTDATIHNLKGEACATYLYRTIDAPDPGSYTLGFGSDDGIKVWLNGRLIHSKKIGRPVRPDDDRVVAELSQGRNELLVKISNAGGRSGFYFRPIGINVPENVVTIVKLSPEQRSPEQSEALSSYYRSISPELKPTRDRVVQLEKGIQAETTTIPVMHELESHKRRETHVMIRGNFLSKGTKVEAAVPDVLHDLPSDVTPNRLSLAHWLTDPSNPLTARVVVNRYWEKMFGRGLVETSEDFGTQGTPPTHPKLLDRLAIEFVDSGWSMKQLVRLMVTSSTYRQASKATDKKIEADEENRYLARGPRFRLEA
ncbi:MAG TPA: DUF1549 domain-containing protein, partial [Pirellulales bacterium]|nr:DUF1549 domain-containing protein [Pirellulales bacterium]